MSGALPSGPVPLTRVLDFGGALVGPLAPIYVELENAGGAGARAPTDAEAAAQAAAFVARPDPLAGVRLPWVERAGELTPLGLPLVVDIEDVDAWAERAEALGHALPDPALAWRIESGSMRADYLVSPAGRILSLLVPPGRRAADHYAEVGRIWESDAAAYLAWEADAAEWMRDALAEQARAELDVFDAATRALEREEAARLLDGRGIAWRPLLLPLDVVEDALELLDRGELPELDGDDADARAELAELVAAVRGA